MYNRCLYSICIQWDRILLYIMVFINILTVYFRVLTAVLDFEILVNHLTLEAHLQIRVKCHPRKGTLQRH